MTQPTERFSGRAADYVAARPGYPPAVLDTLRAAGALRRGARVADIGAGTGISSALFLDAGCEVVAVEPNAAMREAARQCLGGRDGFQIISGTAEATGLANASVDLVAAAQAFHWFDAAATAKEFARILRPGGWITLFWNTRNASATPFMAELEALIARFGTDYAAVHHQNVPEASLRALMPRRFSRAVHANRQHLDRAGLHARLMSASYLPPRATPAGEALLLAADDLFDRHARRGQQVTLHYQVEQYLGQP